MRIDFEQRGWLVIMITIGAASCAAIFGMRGGSYTIVNTLAWFPGSVEAGQIWRLVTHALILLDPLSLAFSLLFLWFVLPGVEDFWGSRALLLSFLGTGIFAAIAAMLLAHTGIMVLPYLAGPGAAILLFVYSFGQRHPDQTFLLMFIIPIKARWFALGYIALRILLSGGSRQAIALLSCDCAGAIIVLLLRKIRLPKRKAAPKKSAQNRGLERKNAALLERFEKAASDAERDAILKSVRGQKQKFELTPCPENDFQAHDPYCLACPAFGFCLARKKI
ncbi:MAG: rhomboid family intramembrane serine protease [Spirochaetota bacterium]|nr:rhomboid family intramembrane serine protease [Spirochaetota bacterium]